MCGINGFVGPDVAPADAPVARRMRETLRHRGPDGHGERHVAAEQGPLSAWLGHRRLKIMDLSDDAHQPMASRCGQIVLTYNGEIYNFRELRRELQAAGHRIRSSGDTEVVLRAYEQWGEGFAARLDGMFALAIWDGRGSGRLVLVRDRTGKKPLFYSDEGGRLTFGSEIKAVTAAPWVQRAVAPERLAEFLTFGYVPHPETLYARIRQVPPGCLVVYDRAGTGETRPYWDALPDRPPERRVEPALLGELRARLGLAVSRRMVADVPVGALLSGGIDSSLVVGMMSRADAGPVRTFTIGFADDDGYDERAWAQLVADHFGTVHTEHVVRANAVALVDRLLWHEDQPFADSSAIPTYLVCELARREIKVAINGDGGDEVFAGYDRFAAVALAQRLPAPAVTAVRALAGRLPRSTDYGSLRRRLERFAELTNADPQERYASWISVVDRDLLAEMLRERPSRADRSLEESYGRAAHLPFLDRVLYANFKTYLPDDLAVKMDRMSMAHSLETRSPFLDTGVIELMATVAARDKVGLHRVKPVLRAAFRPLIPDAIWNRRKHGFGVPVGRWFRGELQEMFEDEVLAHDARINGFLEPTVVRRMWSVHLAGAEDHGPRLWTLLTLERWLRSLERPQLLAPPPAEPLRG